MKKKDVMLFGNNGEINRISTLINVGIFAIIAGVATVVIGERRFSKRVCGFTSHDPAALDTIDGIFKELDESARKGS